MKKSVLEIVKNGTKEKKTDSLEIFTANYISKKLNVSRNLVSQYLNELVREGELIKVATRPVYFFHKKTIEIRNKTIIDQESIELNYALRLLNGRLKPENDFSKLIGCNGSLSYSVKQCKSAISYPPNGLPILLNGPTGTGKSYIAQLMYEYAKNNQIIDNGKFIIVNCSEYANNPELLTANLFGHKQGAYTGADNDNVGLIKAADGGILFLDEVHCLSPESQEKLFLFMDKGIYHMLGDNVNWHQSNVRFIFATTEDPEVVLLKTLLRRIVMICKIPSLNERSMSERKELISLIFKEESQKIGRKIYISNAVYKSLLVGEFKGNIGQMKNHIKAGCADAFLQNSNDATLKITLNNMPNLEVLDLSSEIFDFDVRQDEELIDIEKLTLSDGSSNRIIDFFSEIFEHYKHSLYEDDKFEYFIRGFYGLQNKFFDSIVYFDNARKYSNLDNYTQTLESIFEIIKTQYRIKINNNDILSISRFLTEYKIVAAEVSSWEKEKKFQIKQLKDLIQSNLQKEYHIAQKINAIISGSLDIMMDELTEVVLALIIKSYNKELDINKTPAIIISHGYSTASSIADSANQMIGNFIFNAIDMPLDISSEQIATKVKKMLNEMRCFKEVLLLVDMGSLEEIYLGIQDDSTIDIGIINNANTKLALDIGFKLNHGESIEDILISCSKNNVTSYKYVKKRKREDVILAICPTGIGTSRKIVELIESSLPRKIDLQIKPVEYTQILTKPLWKELSDNYNIKLLVGTINPHIEGLSFVPLENIITKKDVYAFNDLISNYLTEAEIQQFNNNIVQRFSLTNILNYLTILNAEKVLDVVKSVVSKIERNLNLEINPSVKIGLYVHLSCLIERLITKSELTTYFNIEEFIVKENQFILTIKEAASEIEENFSVEIPVEEIGYIFDYINSNE